MCGIAGYIARNGTSVDSIILANMSSAVRHRGPDGDGTYIRDRVGFAHRRLSIFDTSALGAQPMQDTRTGRCIIFNGAIYNHPELRRDLAVTGRVFRTGTDTEVILAAYDAWGADCVTRFNGMWAFAIHDPVANLVFCSRDRFGVKPFYFTENNRSFAFGSELRQITPLLPVVRADRSVVTDFLFTGACDHRAATFFEGVAKLPAGTSLTYDLTTDRWTQQRYYRLERKVQISAVSPAEASGLYSAQLEDAVQLRLRSDVKAGTCLSGGLDSSSIACLASRIHAGGEKDPFNAITAASEDPSTDESAHALTVAEHAGLRWTCIKPTYADFSATLHEVVDAQGEPFAGPSICMQHLVMAAARHAGVKVLLDGQGADETLLGYERYFATHYRDVLRRRGVLQMLREMLDSSRHNTRMSLLRIAGYTAWFSSPTVRYQQYRRRQRWLAAPPQMPGHLVEYARASRDMFDLQRLELESTNLPALLRYEDRNAMWHGVETRLPFLDYRLVETALSLPGELKICHGWTKHVLRKAMENVLPASIVWRTDKRGFEAPDSLWLARHSTAMVDAIKHSTILSTLCDLSSLAEEFPRLDAGTRWRLYSLALWEARFSVS